MLIFSQKPTKEERNAGISIDNPHNTVKPIELIMQVMRLFRIPEQMKIYVPFCGVFSEVIGIMKAGIPIEDIEGCELNPTFYNVGLERLEYWKNKKD
jgi:DNA modification methylase